MTRPLPPRLLGVAAFVAVGWVAGAQQVTRVPQDVADLQDAIDDVGEGDVIEIAAGNYPAPADGFLIRNASVSFTVRAAAGAEVVLDGGGSGPVLRFQNASPASGHPVSFQGLVFRNGLSTSETVAGGVTVLRAEARFIGCSFESNHSAAPTSGGGGTLLFGGSTASFIDCRWTENSADNRGGALSVERSSGYVLRGLFEDNHTNLPGHSPTSAGGAIYALDAQLRVVDSHFEGNRSGWVGGALYAFGLWSDPVTVPATEVLVTGSTFVDNAAEPDSCCPPPGPTFGGAIHVEDQTTLRVHTSQFLENRANRGGGIDGYRAIIDVADSVFRGNLAEAGIGEPAVGGALYLTAPDFADGSTDFGAINRPTGRLELRRSFLQGRFGSTTIAATSGGCLSLSGDVSRMYGSQGVAQQGSLSDNRLPVLIENTSFVDCDVQSGAGAARGGAISADLIDLTFEDSMVLMCDADGGGGLSIRQQSAVEIDGSTFSGNTAGSNGGGAMQLLGSSMQLTESSFIANGVEGSTASQSRGAALYSRPVEANPSVPGRPDLDVTGTVTDSIFSGNEGIPIFEIDSDTLPVNRLVYNGNQFFNNVFGNDVFVNILADRGGSTVAELNGLVIQRSGATSTDKSTVANVSSGSPITAGALQTAPSRLLSPLFPAKASASTNAFLPFAWSGSGAATLDGEPLAEGAGFREVSSPGDHTLKVGSTTVGSASVQSAACSVGPLQCLKGDRFLFDVLWKNFQDLGDAANAVPLTSDTGYFYFLNPANVEIVLKVIDGRSLTDHFWVFYGALSNVEYSITGLDSVSGVLKTYFNPKRNFASVGDNFAFPDGLRTDEGPADRGSADGLSEPLPEERIVVGERGTCSPGPTTLCLKDGRFRAEMEWENFQGVPGVGRAVQLTSDTGYFYFSNPQNVELVVKVLDGRVLNGFFWVFYGALSNVQFDLTVTDTETGQVVAYFNPARTFASRGDTQALPGGP